MSESDSTQPIAIIIKRIIYATFLASFIGMSVVGTLTSIGFEAYLLNFEDPHPTSFERITDEILRHEGWLALALSMTSKFILFLVAISIWAIFASIFYFPFVFLIVMLCKSIAKTLAKVIIINGWTLCIFGLLLGLVTPVIFSPSEQTTGLLEQFSYVYGMQGNRIHYIHRDDRIWSGEMVFFTPIFGLFWGVFYAIFNGIPFQTTNIK